MSVNAALNFIDVFASSFFPSQHPHLAINGSAADYWNSNGVPASITVGLSWPQRVVELALTARNDASYNQSPKDFVLYGSTTGVFGGEEASLLTAANSTGWTQGERRTYSLTVTGVYQYYRLSVSASDGGSHISIAELELNTDDTQPTWGSDQATGSTVTADSQYSAIYAPSKAVDDNTSTMWATSLHGQPWWYQVALASPAAINRLTWLPRTDYDAAAGQSPKAFSIQGSNTGAFSGEQVTIESWSTAGAWYRYQQKRTYDFENSNSYAYYRVVITNTSHGNSAGASEIELMAATGWYADGGDPANPPAPTGNPCSMMVIL